MKISTQEVAKIASLARLEGDKEKLERFAGQLGSILQYMETLNEVDTAGVAPLYSPVSHATPFREDTVQQDYEQEEILGNAPESDGLHFIVPKVF